MNLEDSKFKVGDWVWVVLKFVYRNLDNAYEDWEYTYRKAKIKEVWLGVDEEGDETFAYITKYGFTETVYKNEADARKEVDKNNKLINSGRKFESE